MPKAKKPKKENPPNEALEVIPKVKLGRKCSICFHLDVEKINKAIRNGDSFRSIAFQFGTNHPSVSRHTENCLKLDISAMLEQKRITQAVDHYNELIEQLEFSKKLQGAVKRLLIDTNTDEITFAPRDYEIEVLYQDYNDLDLITGLPKRKKELLSDIIRSIHQHRSGFGFQSVQIKSINYFDAALKSIDAIDKVLDKFAKVDGHYQKERENDEKLSKVAMAFEKFLETEPEHAKDAENWLKIFAKQSGVDLKRLADRVGLKLEN